MIVLLEVRGRKTLGSLRVIIHCTRSHRQRELKESQRRRQTAGPSNITLISADPELNAAAIAEGLLIDEPTGDP
jgi:hypothetical protein